MQRVAKVNVPRVPDRIQSLLQAPMDVGGIARFHGLRADETVAPGGTLGAELRWAAQEVIERDYAMFLQLAGPDRRAAAQADSFGPIDLRFTTAWSPGRIVAERFRLRVDPDAPDGVYDLWTGLYDQRTKDGLRFRDENGRDLDSRISAARIAVRGPPAPVLPNAVGARWEAATLSSAQIASPGPADADCRRLRLRCDTGVVLRWAPRGPTAEPLTVFVHVLDSSGRLVLQHDGPARLGWMPSREWREGWDFLDPHPLPGLESLQPGEYRVVAGLYLTRDGQRLSSDRGDAVEVGTIRVPR